jgi:hypothetical protein
VATRVLGIEDLLVLRIRQQALLEELGIYQSWVFVNLQLHGAVIAALTASAVLTDVPGRAAGTCRRSRRATGAWTQL